MTDVKPITDAERDMLSGDGLVPDRFMDLANAVDAYEARLQQLEDALRRVEWAGPNMNCPECGWPIVSGHKPTCVLHAALNGDGQLRF